jgi:hypothetical protein
MTNKTLIANVALIAVLLAGCNRGRQEEYRLNSGSQPASSGNNPAATLNAPGGGFAAVSYADVVNRAAPAVVTINRSSIRL